MLVSYTTLARRCRAFAFAHTTGQTVVSGTAPVRGSALEAREIERWETQLIFFCLLSQLSTNVNWRRGVHISVSHFPIEPEHDPMQIVVSCATPPVPPSLLEAAANPLTGAEHVAAGSMEYDADVYDSGGEYDFESDDEGESNDEDESDDHHIFFHSANVYT